MGEVKLTTASAASASARIKLAKKVRKTGTLADVGSALGVSRERARQILLHADRIGTLPAWTSGLDLGTARTLVARGYKSKRAVHKAVEQNEFIRGIGILRYAMLRTWLKLN